MESPNLKKALQHDRRLAHKFEQALNLTVEKYISSIKFSLFKEKYPQIHKNAQLSLKEIHHQLQMHLESEMKVNVFELYTEQDVSYLLHTFEKIFDWIQESILNNTVWEQIDSGDSVITDYKDKLKFYLQELSSENDALEDIMFKNHDEILVLKKYIIDLKEDVCGLLDDLSCKTEEISFNINLDDTDNFT